MTSEYFQNQPTIKTSSIKETLSIDSGVCSPSLSDSGHRHSRQTSGGFVEIDVVDSASSTTDSKRSSPDVDRKSVDSEDFENINEVGKKKGWFSKIRNKKKSKTNDDMSSANTLPAVNARQNMEKMKRYSVDALSYLDETDNKSENRSNDKRKSEGDINSNRRNAVVHRTPNNTLHPNFADGSPDSAEMHLI